MRSFAVVFFAASLASAATILKRQATLPACAEKCYSEIKHDFCAAEDITCQCVDFSFVNKVFTCFANRCSGKDVPTAQALAIATCEQAGVDLTRDSPLPACAVPCDQNTTSAICPAPADPNTLPDVACYCKDTAYIQAVDTCFKSSCTGPDLTAAENLGEALCRSAGVDISSVVTA